MTLQQAWKKYRTALGNISIMEAKAQRAGFREGWFFALDDIYTELKPTTKPTLTIVKKEGE